MACMTEGCFDTAGDGSASCLADVSTRVGLLREEVATRGELLKQLMVKLTAVLDDLNMWEATT